MINVINLTSAPAGTRVQAHAQIPTPVQRQAAIENALTMALYFIRQPGTTAANVWAATARTNRAFTLLKQASADTAPANDENLMGRV